MAEPINSATRMKAILDRAFTFSGNPSIGVTEVWAKTFYIEDERPSLRTIGVTRSLDLMFQEVAVMRKQLEQTRFNPQIYTQALTNLEEAFSPAILYQNWNNAMQYLDQSTITSLTYWGAILPDEENQISQEELESLLSSLQEIEASLVDSTLPESLIESIKTQLRLMRESIYKYPISGYKEMKAALTECIGEVLIHQTEFEDNKSSEVVTKFKASWKIFSDVVSGAEKVNSAIEVSKQIYSAVHKLLS